MIGTASPPKYYDFCAQLLSTVSFAGREIVQVCMSVIELGEGVLDVLLLLLLNVLGIYVTFVMPLPLPRGHICP